MSTRIARRILLVTAVLLFAHGAARATDIHVVSSGGFAGGGSSRLAPRYEQAGDGQQADPRLGTVDGRDA